MSEAIQQEPVQTVYSFSVRRRDTQHQQMLKEIKEYCDRTGASFSHMVLNGLAQQWEAHKNG